VIDSAAVFASPRALVGSLLTSAVAIVVAADAVHATTSTPPSTAMTTPTTTAAGGAYADPSGTFSLQFTTAPTVTSDPSGTATSYLVNVDEDSETLSVVAPTAFGATTGAAADERVRLFLDASGDDIEVLANTPTRLGPFPAAYFISRITLAGGKRAVLYGAAVIRPDGVDYVVYTDVGGDDGDRARAFVESYTVLIDPPPVPPVPTTATTSLPTGVSTTASTTTTTVPAGTTVSFDGRWWVRFPDGADVTLRASSADGFTYAEYLAVVGDDTLSVRATELPAAMTWDPAGAAAAEAERTGGSVLESARVTVGGASGVRFTLADADSNTSGDTTDVLLVRAGGQLFRVAFADGGQSSQDAADQFLDSFQLR
jgi:hypothetical protein